MYDQFRRILEQVGFKEAKASLCAKIFADNSRDGVVSHGINRFPVFIQMVGDGLVDPEAEPELTGHRGLVENWDGHLAPGMYAASLAMDRAIHLAKKDGIGCVFVSNSNHWMRGGTYGWQAAEAGCIGICATNTIANMPAHGGTLPRLGNNPLVLAIPRNGGHMVLDMAMSQFSYGKLQEFEMRDEILPVEGGYDAQGKLTRDPSAIRASKRTLPIGFWKGAGLSLMLDVMLTQLGGGKSVSRITATGKEYGLSQFFLCFDAEGLDQALTEDIIEFAKSGAGTAEHQDVSYPGERTLAKRKLCDQYGIEVNQEAWNKLQNLLLK